VLTEVSFFVQYYSVPPSWCRDIISDRLEVLPSKSILDYCSLVIQLLGLYSRGGQLNVLWKPFVRRQLGH
jgi:hypothetical protein